MDEREWSPELIQKFWECCCAVIDFRQAKLLESRIRKGSGTEAYLEANSCQCSSDETTCCGSSGSGSGSGSSGSSSCRETLSPYCYCKDKNDVLGGSLQKITHRKSFISDLMGEVAELAAGGCERVMKKAKIEIGTNNNGLSKRQKAEIQKLCLTQALITSIERYIMKQKSRSRQFNVKDGGLVAWPSSYSKMFPKSPFKNLQSIQPFHVEKIMTNNYATITRWIPHHIVMKLRKDFQWLDMNSLFDDMTPFSPNPNRTGYAMWISGGDLTDELKLPGVTYLLQKLSTLPFELNDKAKLCLTLSNEALLSIFLKDQYHRKHIDNCSSQAGDNGRSITCIYFFRSDDPDLESDIRHLDLTFTLYDEEKNVVANFQPEDNSVVMFKTRDRAYSIQDCKAEKSYMVTHFSQGQKIY